jgi:hypothetical protein
MKITFPKFSGLRCLMMPYIQGDLSSVPVEFAPYKDIISSTYLAKGERGYLTIDESFVEAGKPHRGARAKFGRALHTEAGRIPGLLCWGGGHWGGSPKVTLERDTRILVASNISNSCAVWDSEVEDTSTDGDIGDRAHLFPYETARLLGDGEVSEIGILTPHESLPVTASTNRQFLRIVGSGVHGREPYFTVNPLMM